MRNELLIGSVLAVVGGLAGAVVVYVGAWRLRRKGTVISGAATSAFFATGGFLVFARGLGLDVLGVAPLAVILLAGATAYGVLIGEGIWRLAEAVERARAPKGDRGGK